MQTFFPLPNCRESARCLDRQRQGKQRVEVLQILKALIYGGGWVNHPAVKMWRGHAGFLALYGFAVCEAWKDRGYVDNCAAKILELVKPLRHLREHDKPSWFGDEAFHASHRSNLLRKNYEHYSQFGWTEPTDLPYIWPSPLLTK